MVFVEPKPESIPLASLKLCFVTAKMIQEARVHLSRSQGDFGDNFEPFVPAGRAVPGGLDAI